MARLSSLFLLLGSLSISGCVTTDFTPSRDAGKSSHVALTENAVLAQDKELSVLVAAGGVVLGTLESEGAPAADFAKVHENAKEDGAAEGGSHIVLVKVWTEQPQRMAVMKKVEVEDTKGAPKHGRYLVVRVKPERWGELPAPLRPVALGPWKAAVAASIQAQKDKPVSAQSVAVAVAPSPSAPAPTGAVGFVFGTQVSDAAAQCASLGGKFESPSSRKAQCHGPVEVGFDVPASLVALELCEGRPCQVAVDFPAEPADSPVVQERFSGLRARLLGKYGPATSERSQPATALWSWPDASSVELSIQAQVGTTNAIVHVAYASGAGTRQLQAAGL